MKSHNIRMESLATWTNLRKAWKVYSSGKRRRSEVAAFEMNVDMILLTLSESLLEGNYEHGPYRTLRIWDPKPRLIAVAPVKDRVVHTAVYQALAPLFENSQIAHTYACLRGRGSHRAVYHFLECVRKFPYQLHLDIKCYYPSVNHRILMDLLAPRLRDPRIVHLLEKILASGWDLYQQPLVRAFYSLSELGTSEARGLPIGNLTSQWWGNWYLNGMDHFIKRTLKVRGYLRYMDDLVCFAEDRATLRLWKREIADWLKSERALTLNPGKGEIKSTRRPHQYLGYRVSPAGLDLGRKSLKRMKTRLKVMGFRDSARLERTLTAWRGAINI